MNKMMLALAALLAIAACNTVKGIGQDVRTAGQTLEEAAEDNRR